MSDKKILIALIVGAMFMPAGLHRFYVGKTGQGIITIVLSITLIGLIPVGLWFIFDMFRLVIGSYTDGNGRVMTDWT